MAEPLDYGNNTPEESNAILGGLGADLTKLSMPTSVPASGRSFRAMKKVQSKAVAEATKVAKYGARGDKRRTAAYTAAEVPSEEAKATGRTAKDINATMKKQGIGIRVAKSPVYKSGSSENDYMEVGPTGEADHFQSLRNLSNQLSAHLDKHRAATTTPDYLGHFRNVESLLADADSDVASAQAAHNQGFRTGPSTKVVGGREGVKGFTENYRGIKNVGTVKSTYDKKADVPSQSVSPEEMKLSTPTNAHEYLDRAARTYAHAANYLRDVTQTISSTPSTIAGSRKAPETPVFQNEHPAGGDFGHAATNIAAEYGRSANKGQKLDTSGPGREDAFARSYAEPEVKTINDKLFPGASNRGREAVLGFAVSEAKKHEDMIGPKGGRPAPMGPRLPAPTGSAFASSQGVPTTRRTEGVPHPLAGDSQYEAAKAAAKEKFLGSFDENVAASKARMASYRPDPSPTDRPNAALVGPERVREFSKPGEVEQLRERGNTLAKGAAKRQRQIGAAIKAQQVEGGTVEAAGRPKTFVMGIPGINDSDRRRVMENIPSPMAEQTARNAKQELSTYGVRKSEFNAGQEK